MASPPQPQCMASPPQPQCMVLAPLAPCLGLLEAHQQPWALALAQHLGCPEAPQDPMAALLPHHMLARPTLSHTLRASEATWYFTQQATVHPLRPAIWVVSQAPQWPQAALPGTLSLAMAPQLSLPMTTRTSLSTMGCQSHARQDLPPALLGLMRTMPLGVPRS